MVYLCSGNWGGDVLLHVASEPPPPYSPPRPHSNFFTPPPRPYCSLTPSGNLGDKDPKRYLVSTPHTALNHGPSSAFSPTRGFKGDSAPPPPYSVACPDYKPCITCPPYTHRDEFNPKLKIHETRERHRHNQSKRKPLQLPSVNGGRGLHPRGPLLRTGKSLEIPRDYQPQPPPPTAHRHPGTISVVSAPTARHVNPLAQKTTNLDRRSRQLDAAAALMQPARARPVHVRRQPSLKRAQVTRPVPAPRSVGLNGTPEWCVGRLRSCRSLDELSDLLDDEALPPLGFRSLDDLTEPLYENLPMRPSNHFDNPSYDRHNTSVPDLLDSTKLSMKPQHLSLSSILDDLTKPQLVSPRTLQQTTLAPPKNNAMTDMGVQLEKIRQVARVLGVKVQRGELVTNTSSSSSDTSSSPHVSPRNCYNSTISQPLHLPKGVPYNDSNRSPPGVPARAPVIHDVSLMLNHHRGESKKSTISDVNSQGFCDTQLTSIPYNHGHKNMLNNNVKCLNGDARYKIITTQESSTLNGDMHHSLKENDAKNSLTKNKNTKDRNSNRCKNGLTDEISIRNQNLTENDSTSQESGYSSVDSRYESNSRHRYSRPEMKLSLSLYHQRDASPNSGPQRTSSPKNQRLQKPQSYFRNDINLDEASNQRNSFDLQQIKQNIKCSYQSNNHISHNGSNKPTLSVTHDPTNSQQIDRSRSPPPVLPRKEFSDITSSAPLVEIDMIQVRFF